MARGVAPWLLARRLLEWLAEDAPYRDEAAALLGLDEVCGELRLVARSPGVAACTVELAEALSFLGLDARAGAGPGEWFQEGTVLLTVRGPGDWLSMLERLLIDILAYASGVATRVREMVELARAVNPRIVVAATRKTWPGFRLCAKLAFEAGGGDTHRWGLSDAVIVKDTHVELLGGLEAALEKLRGSRGSRYRLVEVEASTPQAALEAARAGADAVLLDNMSPAEVAETVRLLEDEGLRGRVLVEASGGITPGNIQDYAATGVDVVSTSYPFKNPVSVDVSAEARPLPGGCPRPGPRAGVLAAEHG